MVHIERELLDSSSVQQNSYNLPVKLYQTGDVRHQLIDHKDYFNWGRTVQLWVDI